MPAPEVYSYTRYLRAKQTVDERALNTAVFSRLLQEIHSFVAKKDLLTVLELGGGTGFTLRKLIPTIQASHIVYTVVDIDASHLNALQEDLAQWANRNGYNFGSTDEGALLLTKKHQQVVVNLQHIDVLEYFKGRRSDTFDLIIAQAFLDLFDIQQLISFFRRSQQKGGLLYCPINFDGVSAFGPVIDEDLDAEIEQIYHQSMDLRRKSPSEGKKSHTGRLLFHVLRNRGYAVLEAGGSDWVIYSDETNRYGADEEYFLYHIIKFFEDELASHPCSDPDTIKAWIALRRKQIEEGALLYIAHQLDYLGVAR